MKFQQLNVSLLALAWGGGVALAKMTPAQVQSLPPPAAHQVDFAAEIKPLFEASCVQCHARGKAKGGFSLDTREAMLQESHSGVAVVPGRSAESHLIALVAGVDPDEVMPMKGSRLTAEQVGVLRAWIDQGAVWDTSITFAKPPPKNLIPRAVALPAGDAPAHPVDRLLANYFDRHTFVPPTPVTDHLFARRVFLDVVGLLPTSQQLQEFLDDSRPDKRERLVETLLADNRRYAEHWLTFWNDMLRNDYRGTGYIDGGRKQISAWLFDALARNLPYDRFVAQLVDPTPETEGFVKGIVWRGVVNASQTPPMQAAQNIAQVFMGVNLKCASCHDSFINDWTLADAYGLASVYAEEPLEMFRCDKPTGRTTSARFLYPELGQIRPDASKAERQERLAEIITSPENGRLSRTIVNRLWKKFFGVGLVEPPDDMEQAAWNQDVLDWLAEDLVAHGYDLKHTIKVMLTSRAYQLPAVSLDEQKHADFVFTGPAVRRMSAEQFRDALGSLTGVWFDLPAATFDFSAAAKSEATALLPDGVRWIWDSPDAAQKALPRSVYFRRTITLEERPEEALAVVVCDNSFTLFVNGRKVASGKDWEKPNFVDLHAHLKPGENVLAVQAVNHRTDNKPPTAEHPGTEGQANPAGFLFCARIREAGRVHDVVTDPSWLWSHEKQDGWEKPGFASLDWKPAAALGGPSEAPWNLRDKLVQAMSVAMVHGDVRAGLTIADPLAVALGRPNREQVLTSRASAATTLQALELTNGETLSRILSQGAKSLLAGERNSSSALVEQVFGKALGRDPSSAEKELALGLVGEPARQEGVEDLLWAMTMLPEFQLIY